MRIALVGRHFTSTCQSLHTTSLCTTPCLTFSSALRIHLSFAPRIHLCPSHPLSGTISEKEFKQAIKVLGYAVPPAVASLLYKKLDENHDNNLK